MMRVKVISVFLIVLLVSGFFVFLRVVPVYANPDTLTLTPNAVGTYSQFVEVPNSGFVFGDQFESDDMSAWTGSITNAFSPSSAQVPSGSGSYSAYAAYSSTTYGEYKNLSSAYSTLYMRFYFYLVALPAAGAEQVVASFSQSTTGSGSIALYFSVGQNATNSVYFWDIVDNVNGLAYNVSSTISASTWYCIEATMTASATVGSCALYVDGVQILSKTNINTGATKIGTVEINKARRTGSYSQGVYFDDVVVSSTYIGAENRPALVNDSSDNTALQVTANVTQKETENLADTAQTGTINSVTTYVRAKGAATTNQFVFGFVTHSSYYESQAFNLTTSFALYSLVNTTNPNTSAAWTWAEVNALEVGARASTLATGTIQFSEFYIIVDYSSGAQPRSLVLIIGVVVAFSVVVFSTLSIFRKKKSLNSEEEE